MNNTVMYKGYVGSVDFSAEDQLLFGKVQGIRSSISYEGKSVRELIEDFRGAVDDYLEMCKDEGTEPEIPYKGSLNIRLGRDLHRDAAAVPPFGGIRHGLPGHLRRGCGTLPASAA